MALLECPECKKQVSDQVPSCIHCGYPLRKQAPAPEWETCQIQWGNSVNLLGSPIGKDYFWAEAVSPQGTYCAGVSRKFKMSFGHAFGLWASRIDDPRPRGNDSNATRPFTELVDLLAQDGWEPTDFRGGQWWQYSFRRPVRREQDGWVSFSTVAKWDGYWAHDPELKEENVGDPERFQQAMRSGFVQKDEDGRLWMREDFLIDDMKEDGYELVSIMPIHPDGNQHGVSLRKRSGGTREYGHELSANTKLCAGCGDTVDSGDIECPKCGSGVFVPRKAH